MEGQYERVSQSRELLYSVPAALCEEIARAATTVQASSNPTSLEQSFFSMFLHVFWAVSRFIKNDET